MINMATRAMQLLVFAVAVNCMTAAADMITLEVSENRLPCVLHTYIIGARCM